VVTPDRDNADYVYRVVDLAELNGRHYAKKRNHIKQCLSNHACEYVPITAKLIAECETMQENWCNTRDCGRNPGLCNEANAIAETFAHFNELGLLGGAVRVDGTIQAFAIAEELSPGTAVWHFEKAMADIPGLGQLINHWFSKYGLSGFDYVNREQDLGIPPALGQGPGGHVARRQALFLPQMRPCLFGVLALFCALAAGDAVPCRNNNDRPI
jgi:hypothetical protein